jgi:hypothetical protein
MYDHSGITISTKPFGCRWDSGQIGFIFTTREKVKEYLGISRITEKAKEKISKILVGEVSTYDQYLRGDIYFYEITDKDGNFKDSCYGYYDKEDCFNEAKSIVETY